MAALSLEKIEALAPDQASLAAARKLLKPSAWAGLTQDGSGLAWGECQGSGATPYRVVISETNGGYKCSCPSRKFPCKHSLALMWLRSEGKVNFDTAPAPDWVQDWLRRRRPTSDRSSDKDEDQEKPVAPKNIALTREEESTDDPKAEARAAAAHERTRLAREEAISRGLDDLDQWLADQLDSGLAGFAPHAGKSFRVIAQRLVDAKAPGLAARIETLPPRLYALPEAARPQTAIRELGQLHLLAEAYRKQDALSAELRADVRRAIGWAQNRESLLADTSVIRISGKWRVAGTLSEVQPDRLRRMETWLWREDSAEPPEFALLLDFVPVAGGASRSPYLVGERLSATLAFYPSPAPLRALVAETATPAQVCEDPLSLPARTLIVALRMHEHALIAKPWLETWPLAFSNVRLRRSGERLFIASNENEPEALPLFPAQSILAAPLLALERFDGIALWDGLYARLLLAQTSWGRWIGE